MKQVAEYACGRITMLIETSQPEAASNSTVVRYQQNKLLMHLIPFDQINCLNTLLIDGAIVLCIITSGYKRILIS